MSKQKTMWIYETPPADFFDGLMSVTNYIASINEEENSGVCVAGIIKLAMVGARQVSMAKGNAWEGDIRGPEMYVFGIPDPENATTRLGLVWKQDNNGTTFFCSPVRIHWLDKYELPANAKEVGPT